MSMSISQRRVHVAIDADAAYREDFVRVVAHVGVDWHQAASLAEALSGRRFQACSPADLVPALAQLVALAEHLQADHFSRSHVCDE